MMNDEETHIETNRKTWNEKTGIHISAAFYDHENFLKGKSSLNDIELDLLGDISGKKILHLQCHFGQDTISLSRLGAAVTGVDLSDEAIKSAEKFASETNTQVNFICCNIYDLPRFIDAHFDIVFTSYGTITWLPDLHRWAQIISTYLKPGGKFVFVDFHPVVWMFDDDFDKPGYNYFNTGALVETETGTYADKSSEVMHHYVNWNHSISEIINSLVNNGLEINSFDEFDYSPYDCFKHTVSVEPGKYRIKHLDNKIPMLCAILATKKTGN
ncbi:MAG: class I SAM-dependent methyltransferase [Ginsengibacter sp.]